THHQPSTLFPYTTLFRSRRQTLLYLDLDGFKDTNDVYGHGAGDELLRAVASRLQGTVPAEFLLARVGGDEFAIIVATPQQATDRSEEHTSELQSRENLVC